MVFKSRRVFLEIWKGMPGSLPAIIVLLFHNSHTSLQHPYAKNLCSSAFHPICN